MTHIAYYVLGGRSPIVTVTVTPDDRAEIESSIMAMLNSLYPQSGVQISTYRDWTYRVYGDRRELGRVVVTFRSGPGFSSKGVTHGKL